MRPLADGAQRPKVTGIEISTAQGTVERTIHAGSNTVAVSPGTSSWLRVTLTAVQRARVQPISVFPLGAGLTSVAIPGVHYTPALSTPADESSAFAQRGGQVVFAFDSPLTNANLTLGQTNDDDPLMVRRFNAPAATAVSMLGPGDAHAGNRPERTAPRRDLQRAGHRLLHPRPTARASPPRTSSRRRVDPG